jgi:hypothetical protein
VIENETITAVGSLADVLQYLADEFDAAMPEPSSMSYSTYDERSPIVGLVFKPEGAACVETWVAKYGSKYGGMNRQLFNDGTEWLTTDSVELLGVTVQLFGYDPVEPEVSADRFAEDLPEFTAAELAGIAADAAVPVAETVTEPKRFRGSSGDVWEELPDGRLSYVYPNGKVDREFGGSTRDLVEREYGPLVEVTAQPSTEAVQS